MHMAPFKLLDDNSFLALRNSANRLVRIDTTMMHVIEVNNKCIYPKQRRRRSPFFFFIMFLLIVMLARGATANESVTRAQDNDADLVGLANDSEGNQLLDSKVMLPSVVNAHILRMAVHVRNGSSSFWNGHVLVDGDTSSADSRPTSQVSISATMAVLEIPLSLTQIPADATSSSLGSCVEPPRPGSVRLVCSHGALFESWSHDLPPGSAPSQSDGSTRTKAKKSRFGPRLRLLPNASVGFCRHNADNVQGEPENSYRPSWLEDPLYDMTAKMMLDQEAQAPNVILRYALLMRKRVSSNGPSFFVDQKGDRAGITSQTILSADQLSGCTFRFLSRSAMSHSDDVSECTPFTLNGVPVLGRIPVQLHSKDPKHKLFRNTAHVPDVGMIDQEGAERLGILEALKKSYAAYQSEHVAKDPGCPPFRPSAGSLFLQTEESESALSRMTVSARFASVFKQALSPVTGLVESTLGSALGGAMGDAVAAALQPGLAEDLNADVPEAVAPQLTELLVPSLKQTVPPSLSESIRPKMSSFLSASVTRTVSAALLASLPPVLGPAVIGNCLEALPSRIAANMSSSMLTQLGVGISTAVVPALLHTLARGSPSSASYSSCHVCMGSPGTGDVLNIDAGWDPNSEMDQDLLSEECRQCMDSSEKTARYGQFVARYFSEYYSPWFSKYFAQADTLAEQRAISREERSRQRMMPYDIVEEFV